MSHLTHRFLARRLNEKAQTLLVGTFNPEHPANDAEFFYSRGRNYLWRLLPLALGENLDLKGATVLAKEEFITRHAIDFVDLVATAAAKAGAKFNFSDRDLDKCTLGWREIEKETAALPLKRVFFTRKAFADVPGLGARSRQLAEHFASRNIAVSFLPTPARYYNAAKQDKWNAAIRL